LSQHLFSVKQAIFFQVRAKPYFEEKLESAPIFSSNKLNLPGQSQALLGRTLSQHLFSVQTSSISQVRAEVYSEENLEPAPIFSQTSYIFPGQSQALLRGET
jgi:hypothetical protein